jgi:hypothetical protein
MNREELKQQVFLIKKNNPKFGRGRISILLRVGEGTVQSILNPNHLVQKTNYNRANQEKRKIYTKNNRHKINTYERNKRNSDIQFRLAQNFRRRLRMFIKKNSVSSSEFCGCSWIAPKNYLEKQFDSKMSWNNYGVYWEIDHILPCASFNLSNLEEQQKCFHYSNLRPLTVSDNRSKGAKI